MIINNKWCASTFCSIIRHSLLNGDDYKRRYSYRAFDPERKEDNMLLFPERGIKLADTEHDIVYEFSRSKGTSKFISKSLETENRDPIKLNSNFLMYTTLEQAKPIIYNKNSKIAQINKDGSMDFYFLEGMYNYHVEDQNMQIAVHKFSDDKIVIRETNNKLQYFCSQNGLVCFDVDKINYFITKKGRYTIEYRPNAFLLDMMKYTNIVPLLKNSFVIFDSDSGVVYSQSSDSCGFVNKVQDHKLHNIMNLSFEANCKVGSDSVILRICSYPFMIDTFDPFTVFDCLPFTHYAVDIFVLKESDPGLTIEFERFIYDFNPVTEDSHKRLISTICN